jgi:glucose-6-phosphate isomerase
MSAQSPNQSGFPHYSQNVAGCLDAAIGVHGLDQPTLAHALDRLTPALAQLRTDYTSKRLALLRLPEDTADIDAAETALAKLTQGAGTIVFFGTGGSGLGGQTLAQFAGWNIPGLGKQSTPGHKPLKHPRTRFYDNLDAETLAGALATLDLASTRFVVISKSGGTVETLLQAAATLSAVKAAGLSARIPELFLGVTEPAKAGTANGLRSLFDAHKIPMLDHHTGIGGRFSVLTNVGLLPAIVRGVDVRALRRGAAKVVADAIAADHPSKCAPALGAAAVIALREAKGVSSQVMMPYSDRLGRFGEWFVQLWAESLGKHGKGTTPVACLGPLDQHSQLQLFMDGPHEHLISIVRVAPHAATPAIDGDLAKLAGIGFMAGRPISEFVTAQAHAVPEALTQAGRPVRTFDIAKLDEAALGALLMHFMLETIFAAHLLGVDAFDQPAVELAKTLTRARLSSA